MNQEQRFKEFSKTVGKAIRADINKTVDDYCDKHNISDEKRREFKRVNPIKIY